MLQKLGVICRGFLEQEHSRSIAGESRSKFRNRTGAEYMYKQEHCEHITGAGAGQEQVRRSSRARSRNIGRVGSGAEAQQEQSRDIARADMEHNKSRAGAGHEQVRNRSRRRTGTKKHVWPGAEREPCKSRTEA
jgi:hypothetical protein